MNSRKTFALIDLSAYEHNLRYLTERIRPAKLMAVVKADGYGHGSVELAKIAQSSGVDRLAVAFLEEGLKLRRAGIELPILVLNYVDPAFVIQAREHDLTLTLGSFGQLEEFAGCTKSSRPTLQLVVDTGMRRLGLEWEASIELLKRAEEEGLKIEGAYTHLATADQKDSPFVGEQLKTFEKFLEGINHTQRTKFITHISNSAGALFLNNERFDYVRAGIATYGLQPSKVYDKNLRPVLRWKSCVSFVKNIYPGYGVGYGQTFTAESKMTVATVPVGYGDGYSRQLSNKGYVIIAGRRCPILGRVCMDQFVVDVTHLEGALEPGEEVILIGTQGGESITAEEMADWSDTINYEVTCAISARVPRLYRKGEGI